MLAYMVFPGFDSNPLKVGTLLSAVDNQNPLVARFSGLTHRH